MKKIRFWLATIAVLLCGVPVSAYDFEVDWIYYNITSETDLTVEVTYKGDDYKSVDNEYTGEVVIPEKVTYNKKNYSVTSIGYSAFNGCDGLTSINIPNSVTSIGDWAFSNCSSLTSATIGKSVTSIKYGTFNKCSRLNNITIPNSVTSIGSSAFSGCSSLTSITIPNSVTSIGNHAFRSCSGLQKIAIGNSVASIGDWAFYDCIFLETVINCSDLDIWGGSESYGYVAYYASEVQTLYGGGCIGDYIFYKDYINYDHPTYVLEYYIGNEKELILPESYEGKKYVIGDYAFYDCSSLTNITIPNSVTSIGYNAFKGCSSLTNVTIGNSVEVIGDYAFYGCSSLTNVTIGNSVEVIGDYAFYGCQNLKLVINMSDLYLKGNEGVFYRCNARVINNIDGTVGDYIFTKNGQVYVLAHYAGNDKELTLPENYKGENYKIGDYAFSGCSSLTSVTIPNSVTSIGSNAFYGCSNLASIIIGDSLTSIGSQVLDGTQWMENQKDGLVYMDYILLGYKGEKPTGTIEIKDSTKIIRSSAFYDCEGLTSITIPNSVTSIGNYAFKGCSNLTSITIGNSVTNIGSYAFSGCSKLASISIPSSVTSIEGFAFEGCAGIRYLRIEDSPRILNLGDMDYYRKAFHDCTLDSVYCGRNIDFGDGLAVPFGSKGELKYFTIGEPVTRVDYWFGGCSNLITVTVKAKRPPTVYRTLSLDGNLYNTIKLRIPQGTLAAYQTATGWKGFFNIEEFDPATGIAEVTLDAEEKNLPIYNLQGTKMTEDKENLPTGIYIQGGKKIVVK